MRARAQARVRRALAQHHAGHPPARLNVRRRAVRAAPADLVQAAARQVLRARGARAAGHPGEHPARAPAGGAAGRRRACRAAARGRRAGRRGAGAGRGRRVGLGGARGACGAGRGGRTGPARGGSGGRWRARGIGARFLGQRRRRPSSAGSAWRTRCCCTDGRCHFGAGRNIGLARGAGGRRRAGTAAHGHNTGWCIGAHVLAPERIGFACAPAGGGAVSTTDPYQACGALLSGFLTACRVVTTPCCVRLALSWFVELVAAPG